MRFILFCEGQTERLMAPFLKRWLDSQLPAAVKVQPVRFNGWRHMLDDIPVKVALWLNKEGADDIVAVVSLLDLYGPTIYPQDANSPMRRKDWIKKHIEDKANHARFRHYSAVHEVEAWLLSQPEIFPASMRDLIQKFQRPEEVNDQKPPSRRLKEIYFARVGRSYKKTVNGYDLFGKLDPDVARAKCPCLKSMLDEMVILAREALSRT